MSDRVLVSFYVNCGRMGQLSGLFVTTESMLAVAKTHTVNMSDVLGKHSEFDIDLGEPGTLVVRSNDPELIDKLTDLFDGGDISGINPLDYLDLDEDELAEAQP